MAWGLEARVPFLDKEFLEVSLNIRPEDKTFGKGSNEAKDAEGRPIMEKYILRKAFDIAPEGRVRPSSSFLPRRTNDASTALSPRLDPLAPEGAVLRRRRLFVDRRPQSPLGLGNLGRSTRRRRNAVPARHARDEGGLPDSPDFRRSLPDRCGGADGGEVDP